MLHFFYMRFTVSYRVLSLLAVLLAGCYFLKAQAPTDWYLSKIVDDNSGLPQNSVRSIYYDKKTDFLWLATEAGLARYDGQTTRVFDHNELYFLHSMRIVNIIPSVSGEVKGCNNIGEIFSIQDNGVKQGGSKIMPIMKELEFRKGNFKGANNLSIETAFFRQHFSKTGRQINLLWLTESSWITNVDSTIYLLNNSDIVHSWHQLTGKSLLFIQRSDQVYAITTTGQGYKLTINNKRQDSLSVIGTILSNPKAVFYYDKLNDQPLLLLGNEVYKIAFDNNSISTSLVAILPHLPSYIQSIAFGKNNRCLFVATNASGLYIYQLSPFKVLTADGDDILNNNYASVLTDSNHVFTSRSLLFNLTTGTSKAFPLQIGNLYCMATDLSGNLFCVTYNSINTLYSFKNPAIIDIQPMLILNYEYSKTIYRSREGKIWISTSRYLGYLNGKKIEHIIPYKDEEHSFHYLTETPAGKLLGVSNKGIYSIDFTKKKVVLELEDSKLTQIRTVLVDDDYNCWIGTYGEGIFLYQLKTKKLTRLPIDDKGYLQYSHVFVPDGKDGFFVPTNKGLFRLNKHNLLQAVTDPAMPLFYQYFDVSDGLLTNEFNGGCQPAYNRLPNGDILLPAIRGIVRVKLNELPNPVNNLLFIDKIESSLKKHSPDSALHFEKEERLQTWELGFLQWDHPNAQGVFYRLDAASTWQRLMNGERNIQLNGLDGGQHLLQIKYQYGLLPDQFTAIATSFYIDRYYYETGWFWFGLVVLLAGIIYMIIRIRIRQLKNKNVQLQKIIWQNTATLSDKNSQLEEILQDLREALKGLRENSIFKDRLIGLIGHDMLLPLRFVARIASHLYDEAGTLSPQAAQENSGEIKNTVTELLYLGESLVQWIKLQEGRFTLIIKPIKLRQVGVEILKVHLPMAAVKNNHLSCTIPAGIFCHYDAVLLKVLLHNLLLNANKFTSNGTITINGYIKEKEIHLAVADTGIGMNNDMVIALNKGISIPSQLGTNKEAGWGMGYLLIIDLLRFANGKLLVESRPNQGTNVQFILPLTL